MGALRQIPGLSSVAFSILKPNTQITPHLGDTNTIIRHHLSIQIPSEVEKCGFKIAEEIRHWEEHSLLAFCDAIRHEAWNNSDEERVVLIFDVIRPEFKSKMRWIVAQVRGTLFWHKLFGKRVALIGKLPRVVRRACIKFVGLILLPWINE